MVNTPGQERGDGSPSRRPGVEALNETFARGGIAVPPLPDALAAELKQTDAWTFASRPIRPLDAYMLQPYLKEVLSGEVPDYVAVSHAGHGFNSYALTYLLVLDPIAVLAQTLYGGVYTDNARALERWATLLAIRLFLSRTASLTRSRLGGRLVVVSSNFRMLSGWDLVADGSDGDWSRRHTPEAGPTFPAALTWLAAQGFTD